MSRFELPDAPAAEAGPVKAWTQPVVIPTYSPEAPDKHPMFLENRVYQGSSGRVYPLPFIDRVSTVKRDRAWQAAHIENEFVRVMILPELGGRLHVGLDKTNGYDFFYRQNVIKPALVGLAGPWVSGGVEFNWPQHHRPATCMPVATSIETHTDGSRTIWCSDHDPMNRLKGMHGVCLHPGKAYIELKVRLYNRTPFPQTFLWWANAGVHVHDRYQSFFPPDVRYVADHAGRAMSSFPLCDGAYYGVDYGARARLGASPAPNDLSWYANIPVPTSYMALRSNGDFVGGYDHARRAGVVHVANHHIAPGKKQWTWGNAEFGHAWDRNLTDEDGPYIELMGGVYTDNQPDFSFLASYETRTFSQYWYPIQEIGPAQQANLDAALSLTVRDGRARAGVSVSSAQPNATVRIEGLAEWTRDLAPGHAFVEEVEAATPDLTLVVFDAAGREIIRYRNEEPAEQDPPQAATEPPLPADIVSNDELYLTGLHLEQYRHATRHPEDYWREALRRDPADSRSNNAMGRRRLYSGEFAEAAQHFRRAVATLTRRNPNPYDSEPYYNLGLALRYLTRDEEAYAAFYKATWSHGWRAPAFYAIAQIDAAAGRHSDALEHAQRAVRANPDFNQARNLAVVLLRRQGKEVEAEACLRETLALDPLDAWACWLDGRGIPGDNQMRIDVALDCGGAGLTADAAEVLRGADFDARDGSVPMIRYALGEQHHESPDYCFPSRLEEFQILERAIAAHPDDARAHLYLGNWLYDRRRHREAIGHWERAVELEPALAVAWRNLGIGAFNVLGDAERASAAFERAFAANPADARVLYERDQLWKRIGIAPAIRLAELERYPDLVRLRDDLSVELAALYNQTAQPEKARALLASRQFQPWEGGEGLALGQHERAHVLLGRRALADGNVAKAREFFEIALTCPPNLGESRHPLVVPSEICYLLGGAFLERAAQATDYYAALALRALGRSQAAESLLRALQQRARVQAGREVKVEYFATSLPAMLLFHDDLQKRNRVEALFLEAQALFGLGETVASERLLDEVLCLDQNHSSATDLKAILGSAMVGQS